MSRFTDLFQEPVPAPEPTPKLAKVEDTVVEKYLNSSVFKFKIQYFKNKTSLGSPLNWLAAISHAKGDWIKIMHDDDYFSSIDSLKFFGFSTMRDPPIGPCPRSEPLLRGASRSILAMFNLLL